MTEQPIAEILASVAQADPDRPLVTCGGDTATRGELETRSNRLARAYEARGVRQGDMVTVLLPNSVEFFAAVFAIWKLGATPQPLSWRLPAIERDAIVALAEPSLVVGGDGVSGTAEVPAGFEPGPDVSDEPIRPNRVAPAWKALTSGGSTGRPKLIVSGDPGAMDPAVGVPIGLVVDGVELVPGPLYHQSPFSFAMLGAFLGNHVVVLPRFDAVAALEAIGRYRVDCLNLVPTMMVRMLRAYRENPGAYDLRSLRTVWHSAAPCPVWLKEAWIDLVGPEVLMEIYGGTESQAWTTISGTEWLEHRGSVGRPSGGEAVILDPDGGVRPTGEIGEIFLRGEAGARPSYRYIGAEARVRDGWESLGDLGWMDGDGYLYIADRRTDLILVGGANVYPAEVEAALNQHPAVESCVVVGLPDDDLGQRVHAVVHPVRPTSEIVLLSFLAERLVRYKLPRSIAFVDQILRDDAGKVRRSAVREAEMDRLGLAVMPGAGGPGG